MPWYITHGVLERADTPPSPHSIPTDITGEGDVVIPEGVTAIGDHAFHRCVPLTGITLPDGVTSIGDWAFYNCYNLTSARLPDSLRRIGTQAFSACTRLTDIHLPDGVTYIGAWAFHLCGALTKLHLPEGLLSIEEAVFQGCKRLTHLTVPEGVSSIGNDAFSYCKKLTHIDLPEQMTFIGDKAFKFCENLTDIHLPEGIAAIGDETFSECARLTEITLPRSVTAVGEGAFYRCVNLVRVNIQGRITSIGNEAFFLCEALTSVDLPEGLTFIGDSAFDWCGSLTSITLPESVTFLGNYALRYCVSLTNLTLPAQIFGQLSKNNLTIAHSITCPISPKAVPANTRTKLCVGFARNRERYSDELCAEYIAYLKRNAKKLAGAAFEFPELLYLMCHEKLISASVIDVFIEEALRRENTELTALILSYQTDSLSAMDIAKARECREKVRQRQDETVIGRIISRENKSGIDGLNFAAAGKFNHFAKHDDLKAYIAERGGRLLSALSTKVDYLIANDADGDSVKHKQADDLGIAVISEEEFLKMTDESPL